MNMKKYIAGIMAAALLVSGCGKFVRDELITMQNEIDGLHKQVSEMNESLGTLRGVVEEMAAGGYVVEVKKFADEDGREGYTLVFNDTKELKLYSGVDGKDGEDAVGPALAIAQDEDGRWCWTLDGEFLTREEDKHCYVDGQDGITPQVKIEEGYWYLSVDNGENWEKQEDWPARGKDADEIFSLDPQVYDDRIELVLSQTGETLVIPRFLPVELELVLGEKDLDEVVLVAPGETLSIQYALTGTGAEKALLVAGTDGRFKTAIRPDAEDSNAGTVEVTCPETFPEGGYIYITVNDGNGRSKVKVIRFAARDLRLSFGDESYEADAAGEAGRAVTFMGNYEVEATAVFPEGVEPWLTVTMDSAKPEGAEEYLSALTYDILENAGEEARSAYIVICPKDHPGYEVARITVTQAGKPAESEVDPTDPDDPGDPGDPSDPGDPTDPTDPTDPGDPVDPSDPTDPSDPSDPGDPVDPTDPGDPVDPVESGE